MVDITIVNGVYKPTYNWGAPSCTSLAHLWQDGLVEYHRGNFDEALHSWRLRLQLMVS